MYFRFRPQPRVVLTVFSIHIAHCVDDGIMTGARGKTKPCVFGIACVRVTNSRSLYLVVKRKLQDLDN